VAATADARRAIDLEPDNWTNRVLLGTIDYQAGRRAAALARFRQAARLDSRDPSQVTAALLHRKARAGGFAP
jgi:Flp pilus assembly protein TadD